jgi:hypothetical protein
MLKGEGGTGGEAEKLPPPSDYGSARKAEMLKEANL